MNTLRVLVADPLDGQGVERLRQEPDVEVEVRPRLERQTLLSRIGEFDALVVRSETRVDAELLGAARRLKVVGRAGVGVDNIDVEAATRCGVVVVNTPEANTLAVAEHTLGLMLALARHIPRAHHHVVAERRWERHQFMGVQLAGRTLGLVGLGRIGAEVARRARALGMTVLAYDPYVGADRAAALGVEAVSLSELLARSDFVSIHCPLTPKTRHLIGEAELARMKPGARLINCARGGIVDEAALAGALKAGHLAGAAVDVFEEEPPRNSPLFEVGDRLVVTPHLGASTQEAQSGAAVQVAEDVLRVLRGEFPRHAVNLPAIPSERWPWARPYVELARRLGRLFTELFGPAALRRLEVVYQGELADAPETPALTAAALWGVLLPVLQEGVTLANAARLAAERGMEWVETKSRGGQGPGGPGVPAILLRAATAEGRVQSVGGAVSQGECRLVEINGYRINIEAPGYLLVSSHQDKPGIIGKVGTLLGQHQINIAYMQVGRDRPGGHAVMVVGVDSPVPEPVLNELRRIPDLWDIQAVEW